MVSEVFQMLEYNNNLEPGWLRVLSEQFEMPYMLDLKKFLLEQEQQGKVVFPSNELIFNAFNSTPFHKVRIVILGQDPYHGPNQAHGLSFSVPPGVRRPPSLLNIFKELNRSLGVPISQSGCLQAWAEQGVLLLNATLTVEQATAGSHQKKGWELFTDEVIKQLDQRKESVVFMLWGSYAQKKGKHINEKKHLVLRSVHPSPLSAHRGFIGNNHFVLANDYLKKNGSSPLNWTVSD